LTTIVSGIPTRPKVDTNIVTGLCLQFQALLRSERPDLEHKLADLRIVDARNPNKVLVHMAHLCVISSHAVSTSYLHLPSSLISEGR
jgi:hypothetical protein